MRHPSAKVRELAPDEMDQAFRLWSLAFERGSRNMDHWRRGREGLPKGSIYLGIYEGKTLQAVLGVLNFRCFFGPRAVVPMGGIGAVATHPASRGKGYAGALLDQALARMRESSQPISMLAPFNWEFYQRYGWDWVGVARHYSLPALGIKPSQEAEKVREATAADHAAIRETYARHSRLYRGAVVRHEQFWTDVVSDTESQYASLYVYEGSSGMEGYLAFRGGSRENLSLREFVALTPKARRGLLGLLRRIEMQYGRFTWKAPSDDTLWQEFYNWEIETKLQPVFMGRVVDFKAAFEAWSPAEPQTSSVAVGIADLHGPWNQSTWQVTCEGAKITVAPAKREAQVSLDIRAFSQAYFGTPTLSDLRRAGRVEVHDEAAYEALRRLLEGPPTWMNDFF